MTHAYRSCRPPALSALVATLALAASACDGTTTGPTAPLPCTSCPATPQRRPAPPATTPKLAPSEHFPGGASDGPLAPAVPITPPSGEATWRLLGRIDVETFCPAGGPSAPPVYVALTTRCGDWSTSYRRQRFVLQPDNTQRYAFFVPDGTHNLAAMIDCDGDADPLQPRPGAGDVIFVARPPDASHKPCRTYKLAGRGTIDIPVTLNTAR